MAGAELLLHTRLSLLEVVARLRAARGVGLLPTLLWAHLTNEGSISVPTLVKYPLAVLPSYRLSSTV